MAKGCYDEMDPVHSRTFKNIQEHWRTFKYHIYIYHRYRSNTIYHIAQYIVHILYQQGITISPDHRKSRIAFVGCASKISSLSWASLQFSHLARHLKVLIETLGTSPQDTTGHRMICQPKVTAISMKNTFFSKPLRNDIEQKWADHSAQLQKNLTCNQRFCTATASL